jgi:hypothetical protein
MKRHILFVPPITKLPCLVKSCFTEMYMPWFPTSSGITYLSLICEYMLLNTLEHLKSAFLFVLSYDGGCLLNLTF